MQVVVIGLGLFGTSVAEALVRAGEEVLAVDVSESIVQQAVDRQIITQAACVDATNRASLERLGICADYDVGVVGIGTQVEASIVATIHLKDLGVSRVLSKALHETHSKRSPNRLPEGSVPMPRVSGSKLAVPPVLSFGSASVHGCNSKTRRKASPEGTLRHRPAPPRSASGSPVTGLRCSITSQGPAGRRIEPFLR